MEQYDETYLYSSDVSLVELANEDIIILNEEIPDWHKTSITGKFILEKLRTPKTINELASIASEQYDLPEHAVHPVIEKTIMIFYEAGIISKSGNKRQVSKRQSIEDFPLQQVWFNITEACNLRCPQCFARTEDDFGYAPLDKSILLNFRTKKIPSNP